MSNQNTPVLQLQVPDTAGVPLDYGDRLGNDQSLSSSLNGLDAFVGLLTGSLKHHAAMSGNIATMVGQPLGVFYVRSPITLTEMVAWASTSGSGGVTSLDVQLSSSLTGGTFQSVFANAANRANVSASFGNYGLASTKTFQTSSIPAGVLLRLQVISAAGDATAPNAQNNVTADLFYKPTFTYGV